MPLRSGKEYIKQMFPKETQPFKLITFPDKKLIYNVNIDFDESSREWRKNKISLGFGTFKYK